MSEGVCACAGKKDMDMEMKMEMATGGEHSIWLRFRRDWDWCALRFGRKTLWVQKSTFSNSFSTPLVYDKDKHISAFRQRGKR